MGNSPLRLPVRLNGAFNVNVQSRGASAINRGSGTLFSASSDSLLRRNASIVFKSGTRPNAQREGKGRGAQIGRWVTNFPRVKFGGGEEGGEEGSGTEG